MAKRKKSKRQPKSETAAQAPATDANENAAPSETAADSLTEDPTIAPTIAETSTSTSAEEIPPQVETGEPTDEAGAMEDKHAEASPKYSSEYGAVWSSDAAVEEAVTDDAQPTAQPTENVPAETWTEETQAALPEEPTAEESAEEASPLTETSESAEAVAATTEAEPSETAPTDAAEGSEVASADVAEDGEATPTGAAEGDETAPTDAAEGGEAIAASKLESILESLLFASDKPLGMAELKRLLGERDSKKVTAAVEALTERRKGAGIEVAALSSGWHLRTNPENAAWVSKLLVGRPMRLSRAMLETLAIVAYRQPVTRPEVDDIRGVDCGPVLKTLLDRGLVRIIGKKEEVGRPMLYGTTPEFLRIFNLRDLSELPTLREFYDLSTEDQSRVEAEHGPSVEPPSATSPKPEVALNSVMRGALQPEPDDTDPLLDELDEASQLAKQALGELEPKAAGEDGQGGEGAEDEQATEEATKEATSEGKTGEEPSAPPPAAGE